MADDLRQLMRDAAALAEQLQRARLACATPSQPAVNLRLLEQKLAQTWSAIRLARLPAGPAVSLERRHPKWE